MSLLRSEMRGVIRSYKHIAPLEQKPKTNTAPLEQKPKTNIAPPEQKPESQRGIKFNATHS